MGATREALATELYEELRTVPMFDAHTHLVAGRLGAQGLHDVLLYHMVVSDLYAAGCPSGARLTEYPGRPSREEAHARIREALPYVPAIRNTSCSFGVRTILRDLYGCDEPVTAANWERLDAMVRERATDPAWPREVMRRAGILRFCTEFSRREQGQDADLLHYALEWAFFTRCQWGEYDTSLYELERCWGREPGTSAPIGGGPRPATDRVIRSLDDVRAAIDHYVGVVPYDQVIATATHVSTDLDLRPVTDDEMTRALALRESAGPAERDAYASFIFEAFLTEFAKRAGKVVLQFSFGAEPLPYETASRLEQRAIGRIAEVISRHPNVRFQCFLASRHANQSMCTLCRELPNLSLAGYWWHSFFPSAIRQVMDERLDMLPASKQIGFFSDAYCVEWAYAKSVIVRRQLAEVLALKVAQGQYTRADTVGIARAILHDTPRDLLSMRPAGE